MKNNTYGKCSPWYEQKTKVGDMLMLDQRPTRDGQLEPSSIEDKMMNDGPITHRKLSLPKICSIGLDHA